MSCLRLALQSYLVTNQNKDVPAADYQPSIMILRLYSTMRLLSLALFLMASLPMIVRATALTTTVGPNEKLCFYADVDKEGEKLGVRAGYYYS